MTHITVTPCPVSLSVLLGNLLLALISPFVTLYLIDIEITADAELVSPAHGHETTTDT